MTDKPTAPEPKHPSHATAWSPRTHSLHQRAKDKLGKSSGTQLVTHEDLQTGVR